jgi:hypothetical protein
MDAFVVIATKGRPVETKVLIDYLQAQTLQPTLAVIVGTEECDVEGLADHLWSRSGTSTIVISPKVGLTTQRNYGLDYLALGGHFQSSGRSIFCAFFDDDFRPARDWLERAAERFKRGDIVGLTGQILADGARTSGLAEAQAELYLDGRSPAQPHWASGPNERETGSVYGCNMAFTDLVVGQTRFDENLALYGWQEDRDYTNMAKKLGRVIYFPACRGVHLGANSGGRASGLKFGYSQIANPLYLMRKGTMGRKIGWKFMARNAASNLYHSVVAHPRTDYRGRLRGNVLALIDEIFSRSDPRRILNLQSAPRNRR